MEGLLIFLGVGVVLGTVAPLFDKRITLKRNLRSFANSEITFSILLLLVGVPSYLFAGTNRAFFSGSSQFWFVFALIGIIWLVLGINLSFGRIRFVKILLFAAIIRCFLPVTAGLFVIGWLFSWFSIYHYLKAKEWDELSE